MVGKICPFFPMIGKIFRPFSNDWKNVHGSNFRPKELKGRGVGTRESTNIPNAASRTRMAWRGKQSTLKTMKTASRTLKGGRDVVELSGRGRLARGASGKRETSEYPNVFCNLA
ncbi:MAG: hypothetical protein IKQ15_01330 [Kiritimatiellae bacterium]|nr:hypothetical protein [Kiritimatiellia bacterium]